MPMLGIETALKAAGRRASRRFYEAYTIVKQELLTTEYTRWSAGFPGGNDHGPQHIEHVLEKLDRLLGSKPIGRGDLTPHELFLAMMGVLYHDVGLLRGRERHGEASAMLLKLEPKNYLFTEPEREILQAVVACHSSSTRIEDACAKFGQKEWIGNDSIRPRVLAALVRLADELDEDARRAKESLEAKISLPTESKRFWLFCQRILGMVPVDDPREVVVNIRFEPDDPGRIVEINGQPGSFFVFFAEKLAKINQERITVNRFLPTSLQVPQLRLSVRALESDSNWTTPREFIFRDATTAADFVQAFPELLIKPAGQWMLEALNALRLDDVATAESKLAQIQVLGAYLPPKLRLDVLFDMACAANTRAVSLQSTPAAAKPFLDEAVEKLRQWVALGLRDAWAATYRTAESEVARMGSDSDLRYVLIVRRAEIEGMLPEHLRASLPKDPPAERGSGGGCVPVGTLIRSARGPVKVEDIRTGDQIISVDPARGYEQTITTVRQVHAAREPACVRINDDMLFTPSQPLLTSDGQWISAGTIRPGMLLATLSGETYEVRRIEEIAGYFEVFTLTCQEYGTYVAQDLVCHNVRIDDTMPGRRIPHKYPPRQPSID